jgi:alpha-L-rhamnosidase
MVAMLGSVGALTPAVGHGAGIGCPPSLCRAISPDGAWRALVIDPTRTVLAPKRVSVIRGAGAVIRASVLLGAGEGQTTITATSAPGPALLLDMGTDVGGRVLVRVLSSTAPLRLAYSERLQYMTGHGDTQMGSLGTDDDPDGRFDVIAPSPVPHTFVSPGIVGGERWIRVSLDAPGMATIQFVRVRYDGYPPSATAYAGHFLSNDPLVNRTWYASVYTEHLDSIKAPHANRVLVDGAKRDRLVWLGDLAIEGLTAFYSSPGEVRVLRDSLAMFACQQEPSGFLPEASLVQVVCPALDPTAPGSRIPPNPLVDVVPIGSYTPWWIVGLYEYYLYTGDTRFVRAELPAVRGRSRG